MQQTLENERTSVCFCFFPRCTEDLCPKLPNCAQYHNQQYHKVLRPNFHLMPLLSLNAYVLLWCGYIVRLDQLSLILIP